MDAKCAFYQVKIGPEDERKTVFVARYGLYEFACMGFRLSTTFFPGQELGVGRPHLEYCSGLPGRWFVLDKDFEDHLANLRTVFTRFRELDLKVKPKKYAFFRRRVEFLGRQVSPRL